MWCGLVQGQQRECLAPSSCPRALQSTQTPPCSASGPLPRPLPTGLRVFLSFPLTKALPVTVLDLKTSCLLPSCGQLKELPPALTPGQKENKNSDGGSRCAKHCTGCFLYALSLMRVP